MRSQASSHKKPKTMVRIIKTPIRAIAKVLDLYVKGITSFSNTYNRPLRAMVEVTPTSQLLPRSFTTSILPDNDQPTEGALVRSISTGTITNNNKAAANIKITNLELYMIQHHRQQLQPNASKKGMPRSCVVGMGKIDEDRASSFRDENIVLKNKLAINDEDSVCSKNRSYDRVPTKRSKFI